jgi:uncharacterized protein YegP (UPF0339 family)
MAAKYDLRTSSDGQYHFNVKAFSGKVIPSNKRCTTEANVMAAGSGGRPS